MYSSILMVMIIEAEKQENARVKAGEKELTDVTILQ